MVPSQPGLAQALIAPPRCIVTPARSQAPSCGPPLGLQQALVLGEHAGSGRQVTRPRPQNGPQLLLEPEDLGLLGTAEAMCLGAVRLAAPAQLVAALDQPARPLPGGTQTVCFRCDGDEQAVERRGPRRPTIGGEDGGLPGAQ